MTPVRHPPPACAASRGASDLGSVRWPGRCAPTGAPEGRQLGDFDRVSPWPEDPLPVGRAPGDAPDCPGGGPGGQYPGPAVVSR
jgi:hypothetical protein